MTYAGAYRPHLQYLATESPWTNDILREAGRVQYGAVYTRSWVAEFILDLCGYQSTRNLVDATAVEPSCGNGEFLETMIRRLSSSCHRQGRPLRDCIDSLQAFELDPGAVTASRERAESVLLDCGWDKVEVKRVVQGWIREGDFLLDPDIELIGKLGDGIDFVIGNPPYIRLEAIDQKVADCYRKLFKTMTGRADIYVGFYEKALSLLKPEGICGFICADRWMLNQYGSNLRRLITEEFSVEAVIEMHNANAFQNEVLAYPAITVIRREKQGKTLVARIDDSRNALTTEEIVQTAHRIRQNPRIASHSLPQTNNGVVLDEWFQGSAPWPCVSPKRLQLLKSFETAFSPLEDASTKTRVGIGVATGADKVFITNNADLVERDRLLPMALAKDTVTGELEWSGYFLVNPWAPDGSLIDLQQYPQLYRYFAQNEAVLKRRNVAQRNPERWFRTIDKVNHALTSTPKLLIPDIKSTAHPVFDSGTVYPHHNLYYVISETWDLKVLGGILLSKVGQFFIECYAVRMQGGFLRFQAQYLRRIRVPKIESINAGTARALAEAFEHRDVEKATEAALAAYKLDRIPE
jgi:adenine-specific DNA-methyltransferase